MPSVGGRSRTFDPSLENGQATLVTPSLGIARPRRPGPNPRDLLPLEPAGSHWMVGGPNEQRVVELFTSWRAENEIAEYALDVPQTNTLARRSLREAMYGGTDVQVARACMVR
jgi:hypothetical protein